MVAVHQFAPRVARGDAVGQHVLALRELFRSSGHPSEAYAVETPEADVLPHRRLFRAVAPEDLLLLHYSIGSEHFATLARVPARRILVYHNVTPPEFFAGTNPHAAAFAERGRRELGTLGAAVELAVAMSEFSRADLVAAGFARTAVAPILVDWRAYDVAPEPRLRVDAAARIRVLFVGRLAPNKRQDDLVRVLAYLRRCVEPSARLVLVGDAAAQPRYAEQVRVLGRTLGVADAITWTGQVGLPGLVAAYRAATCFLSLSQHEGFGVPLLEAMRFGVPVLAYDAGAVSETLGDGGLLLATRDPAEVGEACALVHERASLREALVAAGERRVAAFSWERVGTRWREVLGL